MDLCLKAHLFAIWPSPPSQSQTHPESPVAPDASQENTEHTKTDAKDFPLLLTALSRTLLSHTVLGSKRKWEKHRGLCDERWRRKLFEP